MNDYSELRALMTGYDVLANVGRGWNGAKVEAAFQRFSAECKRLGITIAEGRYLARQVPGTGKVEVTGPAHVLTDGNAVRQFATAEEADAARNGWQPVGYFVPAGESRSFSVAA